MKRFCCVVALLLLAIVNNGCTQYQYNMTNFVMLEEDTCSILCNKSTQLFSIGLFSLDSLYDWMSLELTKDQFLQFRDELRELRVLYTKLLELFQEYEQEFDPTTFPQGNFLDFLEVPLTATVYFAPTMKDTQWRRGRNINQTAETVSYARIQEWKMHQSSDCNLVPVLVVVDDGTPYFSILVDDVVDDKDPSISACGGLIAFKSPEEIDDFIKKCDSVFGSPLEIFLEFYFKDEFYKEVIRCCDSNSVTDNEAVQSYLEDVEYYLKDIKYFVDYSFYMKNQHPI